MPPPILSYAVTCIQFNPVDDRFFISGSLDAKVRLWSIPDRQVVDWTDLNEMVTAASYTPDGQVRPLIGSISHAYDVSSFISDSWPLASMAELKGAIIGSHKGSCRLYKTTGTVLVAGKCAVCLLRLIVSPLQQTASLARRRRSISRTRSARRKQRRLPDSRYTYIPSHRVSIQAA